MGTPVRRCVRAEARSISSSFSVMGSSVATLMIPALISVPSIPCSTSRTHKSATKSLSLPQKLRGISSQQPVQQMNCIPVSSETSFISRTSRPRSIGETSTTVSTPPFLASLKDSRAISRALSRSSSSGYVVRIPAEESIRCSWGKVNPRSAVSNGPSTEFTVAMPHLRTAPFFLDSASRW